MPEVIDIVIQQDVVEVALVDVRPAVQLGVQDPQLYAPLHHRHDMSEIDGLEEFTLIAGEVLNGQKLLMMQNGQAYLFDPSDEANADKVVGFSNHAAETGAPVAVRRFGPLESMVLIPDAVYYAGPIGSVTATIPTSGVLLRVGTAKDAETLLIDIATPIIIT